MLVACPVAHRPSTTPEDATLLLHQHASSQATARRHCEAPTACRLHYSHLSTVPRRTSAPPTNEGEMGARTYLIAESGSPQPLLGTVLRSDDDRKEEARIKGSAQAAPEANIGCLSNHVGEFVTFIRKYLLGKEAGEANPMTFSLLDPGSAATDDSSLLLNPDSGNTITLRLPSTPVLLIAFTIMAYVLLNVAVFALTPTTRALSQYEHTAVAVTLCIQVASLLHDALSRKRISKSELDTHLCIVVVKALAALTNAILCFLPATPFIVDLVTGRPNSMLRWVRCQSRTRTPP